MMWELMSPEMTAEHLGFLPFMVDENDPDDAITQFDKNYVHGGGWRDYNGFEMESDGTLICAEDPPLHPLAQTRFRDETIYVYQYAWVAVRQPDGTYRVARMD